ncbi:DEAD-box ATP-dependent RNA helicase 42 [Durusdinium trenchii]|uniref:RNA helicase n=1 Tax=Durusdinium trenchii TaxID=1381693 RepID=A0ABP0SAI3_9DINO
METLQDEELQQGGAKADAAKKRARDGFGEGDGDWMESDPDRSEQSSEEQMESYFDLVKRFTTKKTLPAVNHDLIDYKSFRKNLYVQVKEITNMKDHEVEDLRRTHGDITVRGKRCPHPVKSFLQCGLPEKILKIMEKREYETPFPIQMQAMPALMCGRDVIGVAQTGSGKTIAYLLPLIRHIMDQPPLANGDGPVGFVVAPTRELALQIQREANTFCKAVNLTSVCAYGGGPMGEQLSALKKGAELLVGTPGRLIDVLTTSGGKITNLRRVTFLVLDEADRMFDMGFEPQIGMFLQSTRPDKQVAMFSATLPAHVEALARKVLKKPLEISVGERNAVATNVTQFVEVLDESQKFYRLLQLLGEWHEHGAIIIFVHQQKDVDEMFTELLKYGYPPLALHGGQDQQDRDFTLQDFKDGISNILISTSVAARGIDVKNVILVVNFKVPDHLEDYIHRVGRTGRAGKAGFAYTFIQPDEADKAQDMVDALRQCNQEVPGKLKALAEEHQTAVNTGQARKRKRWGGFGGKSFSYENSEKSRQQQERQQAKSDLLIGDFEEEDDFKDPWLEPDKPKKGKGKGKRREEEAEQSKSADPADTVAQAAKVAAKMQAPHKWHERPKHKSAATTACRTESQGAALGDPRCAEFVAVFRPEKRQGAPGTSSANGGRHPEKFARGGPREAAPCPDGEARREAAKGRAGEGCRGGCIGKSASTTTCGRDQRSQRAGAKPCDEGDPTGSWCAWTRIGSCQRYLVTKAIESLQSHAATPGAGTSHLAEEKAAKMLGQNKDIPAGMHSDELEINDYPQIARQKITHREPLVAIEEMTGAKVQVKGQHFASTARMPEGAKKLYVEILGPTQVAVAKAKHEVFKMMEALAIRTLNIPGLTRAVTGTPGRYDPATGK